MTKTDDITQVQAETLAFIAKYVAQHGYSPTVSEMANEAKVYQNAMSERLAIMLRKGVITKTPGIARSIRPVCR